MGKTKQRGDFVSGSKRVRGEDVEAIVCKFNIVIFRFLQEVLHDVRGKNLKCLDFMAGGDIKGEVLVEIAFET